MITKQERQEALKKAKKELRDFENSWEGWSGTDVSAAGQCCGGAGSVGWTSQEITEWDEQRDQKLIELNSKISEIEEELRHIE